VTSSTYQRISIDRIGGVGTIVLDDAEHGNALEPFLMEAELAEALRTMDRDRSLRAILLKAAGSDFCAGGRHLAEPQFHDVRDRDVSSTERLAHGYSYGTLWEALAEFKKPLVCAVRGRCADGGFGIALASDVVVAGESATFVDTSVVRGRSPFWPTAPILVQAIGKHVANEVVLLGRTLDAHEARRLGLITDVVDDALCEDAAAAAAEELAERPPVTISLARHLIRKAVDEMGDYALTRSYAYHTLAPG